MQIALKKRFVFPKTLFSGILLVDHSSAPTCFQKWVIHYCPNYCKAAILQFFKKGKKVSKTKSPPTHQKCPSSNVSYECALDPIRPANVFIFTLDKKNSFEKLFFTCFTFRQLVIPLPHHNVMPSIAVYIVKKKKKKTKPWVILKSKNTWKALLGRKKVRN